MYESTGNTLLAMEDYTSAIRLDEQLAIAYYARGSLRYGRRELDLAMGDFSMGILLEPNNAKLIFVKRKYSYHQRKSCIGKK